VLPHIRIPLLAALLLGAAGTLAAQSTTLSPSPTLPSDTLEANFAPRSSAGPMPDLAPTLPSDTLEATEPVDSFPTEPFLDDTTSEGADSEGQYQPDKSGTRGDSAALKDLKTWIERHPGLMAPPPVRAVLVRV
jgi:hypothetical protein